MVNNIIVTTILLCCLNKIEALELTPIPSGIVITSQEEMYRESAYVETYIILGPAEDKLDRFRILAHQALDQLRQYIHGIDPNSTTGIITIQKIDILRKQLGNTERRGKRGLLNFIGEISYHLFGTARAKDVDNLKKATIALSQEVAKVVSNGNRIIAVINQMGHTQREMVEKLNDVITGMHIQSDLLQQQQQEIRRLDVLQRLTASVSTLETQINEYFRQLRKAEMRRVTCQMLQVTEEVLPVDVLQNIITSAPQNQKVLPAEWYYQALKVEYMFVQDNMDVCKVHIPLLFKEEFIRYSIKTFPVLNSETEGYVQIYHDVNVAASTTNDVIMFPDNCIGRTPVVCHNGALFDQNQFSCIQGLLSNDNVKLSACSLVYYTQYDPALRLQEIGFNTYVDFMKDGTYYYRCEGKRPQSGQIKRGAYIIEVDNGCTLDTTDFLIQGIDKISKNYMFNVTPPEIVDISIINDLPWQNLSAYMRAVPHLTKLELPSIAEIPKVMDSGIEHVVAKYLSGSDPWFKSWWFWMVILFGMTVFALCIVYCIKSKINGCRGPDQSKTSPKNVVGGAEGVEVASLLPQQSPTVQPSSPPLYPSNVLHQFNQAANAFQKRETLHSAKL